MRDLPQLRAQLSLPRSKEVPSLSRPENRHHSLSKKQRLTQDLMHHRGLSKDLQRKEMLPKQLREPRLITLRRLRREDLLTQLLRSLRSQPKKFRKRQKANR